MNKIVAVGRLTKDIELRYSQRGDEQLAVGRFSLAVDRGTKGKDGKREADFIPCVVMGKRAEVLEKYVKKGDMIALEGSWRSGSYQNQEGKTVYTNEMMISGFTFVGGNKNTASSTAEVADDDGFMNIPQGIENGEYELPFD